MLINYSPSQEEQKKFREKALEILVSYSSLEEYFGISLLPWEKEIERSISQEEIENYENKLDYRNRFFSRRQIISQLISPGKCIDSFWNPLHFSFIISKLEFFFSGFIPDFFFLCSNYLEVIDCDSFVLQDDISHAVEINLLGILFI